MDYMDYITDNVSYIMAGLSRITKYSHYFPSQPVEPFDGKQILLDYKRALLQTERDEILNAERKRLESTTGHL